jgi:hypothetical protein
LPIKKTDIQKDLDFFTRLSSTLNREIGICVCDNGESSIAFGNECSGQIRCGECEPKILFHTHPSGTAHPSIGDIQGIANAEGQIKDAEYCVGALKDGVPDINCIKITKR